MEKIFILTIVVLLILCCANSKLLVHKIILKHILSLRNDRTNKISLWDIITLLIFPFIISGVMTFAFNIFIEDVNVLLTVFSIFAALLFNFLMLIIQMKDDEQVKGKFINTETNVTKYYQCLSETYYNVSFAILISIIEIMLLLFISMIDTSIKVFYVINMITWAFMIVFFLTLIMILKRIFIIYNFKYE